jgi:uncharacterized protein
MITINIVYFIIIASIFAGLIYGVFGGGSGLFLMPAYYFALHSINFNSSITMQMAIATTAISTPFIALPALIYQYKNNMIDVFIVKKTFIGLLLGSSLAVTFLNFIPSTILKLIFGYFVVMVSIWLIFYKQDKDIKSWSLTGLKNLLSTTSIGFLWFSLGVAVFTVPYLLKCKINIHKAIGTATFIGSLFGLIVGLMFIVTGYLSIGMSYNHIGFVNTTFLYITIPPGMLCALIGSKISNRLPKDKLKYIYAALVFIVGLLMIL